MIKFIFKRKKMAYRFLYILLISLVFTGCSQKVNIHTTLLDNVKEQALTQTKKARIKDGEITKAFVVVTYISEIKHESIKEDDIEKFIVNIHIASGGDKELYDKLKFRIDGQNITKVTKLDSTNEILKLLPSHSPWAKYFLVEAPIDEEKKGVSFGLTLSSFTPISMSFSDKYGNLPMGESIGFETKIVDD